MKRIIMVLTVAALMAVMLVAGALPMYAAESDTSSCVAVAFSEATPGTQGVLVRTAATGNEPGFVGVRLSTFGPLKAPCL